MPRAKYTKPPGPLPAIEQVQRSKFQFRDAQWRNLTKLLPCKLGSLGVPPHAAALLPAKVQTIADWVIQLTEEAINCHHIGGALIEVLTSEERGNPANIRAAIRRLREHLKPFVEGRVDDETTNIVTADLDAKLAARDQEIAKRRLPPAPRRALAMLCQLIAGLVRLAASANCETVSEQDILCYVDAALNFAGIKHPNIKKHRDRFAALVFPQD